VNKARRTSSQLGDAASVTSRFHPSVIIRSSIESQRLFRSPADGETLERSYRIVGMVWSRFILSNVLIVRNETNYRPDSINLSEDEARSFSTDHRRRARLFSRRLDQSENTIIGAPYTDGASGIPRRGNTWWKGLHPSGFADVINVSVDMQPPDHVFAASG